MNLLGLSVDRFLQLLLQPFCLHDIAMSSLCTHLAILTLQRHHAVQYCNWNCRPSYATDFMLESSSGFRGLRLPTCFWLLA